MENFDYVHTYVNVYTILYDFMKGQRKKKAAVSIVFAARAVCSTFHLVCALFRFSFYFFALTHTHTLSLWIKNPSNTVHYLFHFNGKHFSRLSLHFPFSFVICSIHTLKKRFNVTISICKSCIHCGARTSNNNNETITKQRANKTDANHLFIFVSFGQIIAASIQSKFKMCPLERREE